VNKLTAKNLYSQVIKEIEKRVSYNTKSSYNNQTSRSFATSFGATSDATTAEIVSAIQDLLEETLPSTIIDGLEVVETDPISRSVTVNSGRGAVGGVLYELTEDLLLQIPFDSSNSVFYIVLYKDMVMVEKTYNSKKLTIAKIVVPKPGTTSLIQDDKDESWNAYIVNFKEYKLYGYNDRFEEDTIELLRDNISPILADNLIGNIRLSEDLKIINTQGSVELNSESLKLLSTAGTTLAKFNRNGTFFYDDNGIEIAKFTTDEARVGNIRVLKNSIQSSNFSSGSLGFCIKDDGNVEFNDITARGTIYATSGSISGDVTVGGILSAITGSIGGWTITANELYATTTGTIKTSLNAGSGYNGVVLDKDGIRVYDDVLGEVVNLPSDGSAPKFSSGTIEESIFEINTNAVLRTSSTVGDGTASSAGILINNTGVYGCQANQLLLDANLKALIDGTVSLKGEIVASSGQIGDTIITSTKLSGGLIEGATVRGSVIENRESYPKVRLDDTGFYFQTTSTTGKYGSSESGSYGFKYGDSTKYGSGVVAYLFNSNLPPLSIVASQNIADVRFYNRASNPASGTHQLGDFICVSGILKRCTTSGTPGTFTNVASGDSFVNLSSIPLSAGIIPVDNIDVGTTANKILQLNSTAQIPAVDGSLLTKLNKYIYFVIPEEALVAEADKIGRIYVNFAGTIKEVHASVKTAPTGASIIVDINKNGSTIWATQSNRVTIAATEYVATQSTFDTTALVNGDYLTIDLDQVGSTIAGAKIAVRVKIETS
jgi:hypothetical protein